MREGEKGREDGRMDGEKEVGWSKKKGMKIGGKKCME